MKPEINMEGHQTGEQYECRVRVVEGSSSTEHRVTVEKPYRDHVAGPEIPVEQLIRKSFEFLLEREPKESILRRFELRMISRYFPEYEKEMRRTFRAANEKR